MRNGLFVLLAVTCVVVAAPALAADTDVRVMSFNVRFSTPEFSEPKAENNWNDPAHPRRKRALCVICDYRPDVLGVQEARHLQIVDLQQALCDYDFYGTGRDDGKTKGEYSGIFWRKDRFSRAGQGSFWLSATPERPGTTFHTRPDAVPRIASWVKLVDNNSGREFLVLNMHWDHESEPARQQSARLVRERLAKLADNLPAIVMGDLNTGDGTPAIAELLGGEGIRGPRLTDSYRQLHPAQAPDEATYHDWTGQTKGSRIDFILHTREFSTVAAAIVRTAYDGRWPSDHYPVTATLRIESRR
jgi:endonuclease/exonuclease/phosphatase family metal-dependent hydrolase